MRDANISPLSNFPTINPATKTRLLSLQAMLQTIQCMMYGLHAFLRGVLLLLHAVQESTTIAEPSVKLFLFPLMQFLVCCIPVGKQACTPVPERTKILLHPTNQQP